MTATQAEVVIIPEAVVTILLLAAVTTLVETVVVPTPAVDILTMMAVNTMTMAATTQSITGAVVIQVVVDLHLGYLGICKTRQTVKIFQPSYLQTGQHRFVLVLPGVGWNTPPT